jgi:hypothetical protein
MTAIFLDLVVDRQDQYNALFESTDSQAVRDWLLRNIEYITTYAVLLGDSLTFVSGTEYLAHFKEDTPSEG